MNAISSISSMCSPDVPIFVRTFSSVMNFRGNYMDGAAGLVAAGWSVHQYDEADLVAPDGEAIAWYENYAWHVARRHETARFNPHADRAIVLNALGQPMTSFVLPTTVVVPLVSVSTATGRNVHCLRIHPPLSAPPFHRRILGSLVEFRVCTSEVEGHLRTYAEANFGGARFTATLAPRRAIYIADHKLLPSALADALIAEVLLYLPKFSYEAGFVLDSSATRTDIPRVGHYRVLPRHGTFYAEVRQPAPSAKVLLTFEATRHHRIAQAPVSSATIVMQEDEIACAMAARSQKRVRPKPLPIMASVAEAVRTMMIAKKWLRRPLRVS